MRTYGMILHDDDAETPFRDAIDCRFPYDEGSASDLIRRGWEISLNAAFCVLDEICRPPRSRPVARARLRELAAEWAAGPDHPLKTPVLRAANALIEGTPLSWRDGVDLMITVGRFDGQRAALGLIYCASDCESPDGDHALSRTDADIRDKWKSKGV